MELGKWRRLSLELFNNSALFEINKKEQIKPNQRKKNLTVNCSYSFK